MYANFYLDANELKEKKRIGENFGSDFPYLFSINDFMTF